MVQAKLYIDAHYAERIKLDKISDEAYFSKYHFLRLFKSIYGKTPHQYLIALRISKAKELLQSGCSVSDACSQVGFDSLGSFTTLFRKSCGLTPAHFQRQVQQLRQQMEVMPLAYVPGCFASVII